VFGRGELGEREVEAREIEEKMNISLVLFHLERNKGVKICGTHTF
jgi:hypothetical protein